MSSNNNNQPPLGNLTLEIRHLDVIGGDSTLIFVKDNDANKILYKMLIDSGAEGSGGVRLVTYLSSLAELKERVTVDGKEKEMPVLDCVVATHYHLDHIEGFTRFSGAVLFRRFIDNAGYRVNDETVTPRNGVGKGVLGTTIFSQYTAVVSSTKVNGQAAKRLGVPFIAKDFTLSNAAPFRIPLGENTGVTLTCYCANGILANGTDVLGTQRGRKNRTPSPNDVSLALLLEWENFRYFTAGDLSGDPELQSYYNIEEELLNYLTDSTNGPLKGKKVTVLRVSHHGSEHSNQPSLFSKLEPEVIVVSCNTKKKVPSPVFLQRLNAYLATQSEAVAVFVNTLYYSDKDERYTQLDAIKGSVPAGNLAFIQDNGANVVTNSAIKTVHIRRRSAGRVVDAAEDNDFKTIVKGTYEIVLGKRSANDQTAELKTQKLRTFKLQFTIEADKVKLGADLTDVATNNVMFRDFDNQANLMVNWLREDESRTKTDGEDYIRLNYPGLTPLVEKTTTAIQLQADLVAKMKDMFNKSFELTTQNSFTYFSPKGGSGLSLDEKETLYYLLVLNQHQKDFNKVVGYWKSGWSPAKFLNQCWNTTGGDFVEPYGDVAKKRNAELAFDNEGKTNQ